MNDKFKQFDDKAAEWNSSARRIKRSETIAEEIRDKIQIDRNTADVMDFGCGTGHLSFILSNYARSVTAVDGSEQMICLLNQRIADSGVLNIKAVKLDVDHEVHTLKGRKFDLITSSMVLHHLKSPEKVIRELKLLLKDSGTICLVDLDKEDGSFHNNDPFVPHHGFDRNEIKKMLERLGFFSVTLSTPMVISRPGKDNIIREFPLFMAIGRANPPLHGDNTGRGEF